MLYHCHLATTTRMSVAISLETKVIKHQLPSLRSQFVIWLYCGVIIILIALFVLKHNYSLELLKRITQRQYIGDTRYKYKHISSIHHYDIDDVSIFIYFFSKKKLQ